MRLYVVSEILKREGWPQVTEHPADLGGLTKGGITMRAYNLWRLAKHQAVVTRQEFLQLTVEDAYEFIDDEFCSKFEFVVDERLYALLCDWAVNAGVDDPAKALQTQLKREGLYDGQIDGIPGPLTRMAFAGLSASLLGPLYRALVDARVEFHFDRAFDEQVAGFLASHPTTQLHNLRGWTRRAMAFY